MRFLVGAILLGLVSNWAVADQDSVVLVREGQAQCVIVRGAEDEYAGERLQRWFAEEAGAEAPLVVGGEPPAGVGPVILLGTAESNPLLRRIAAALDLDIAPAGLTGQGYVARTAQYEGRDWLILAGGGRAGVVYAVTDLINWRLDHDGGSVTLPATDAREIPQLKYRWFWNWDHRMDWGGGGRVGTLMGGGGTFSKEPEAFLVDGKRCLDYMADHKFNGLILWGFLRDTHGGVEASQELCRYAKERGVRILPGVGTSGYAGYYFEGEHPYNANTWLAEHPELRSIDGAGKPRNAPCPSKKVNQEWLDEGARWLFDTFDVGGVNLEMGDFFVCYCDDCKRARASIDSDEPDYYKDMAISHSVTLETMRRLSPGAWLSYATYTGYSAEMTQKPPEFLAMIPDDALCQWTLTRMARSWPAGVKPMARHNVGYLHWCNRSTHTENDFYLNEIRDICRNAAGAGFEGLDTYGELPPEWPNVELFYLAWEAFLWDPEMTIEQFAEERLGRLYGGADPARALLEIIPLVRTVKEREKPDNVTQAKAVAQSARDVASPDGIPRWERLIAYLDRHEQAARARLDELRRREAEARRGRIVPVMFITASDEDPEKGWVAGNAIDGNVQEPGGCWLTRYSSPEKAWLELALGEPSAVNQVSLFHQLNARHYRSLDYTVSVRADGQWHEVTAVTNNDQAGWVGHVFPTVTTDAVRLEITRSAHNNRMGIGEIELRMVDDKP